VRLREGWSARIGGEAVSGARDVVLAQNARIAIGELSVLLQLVERPAVRPKAPLPPSVRGGLLSGIDHRFTAFVTGSLVLHFALAVLLAESDWPVEQFTEDHIRMVQSIVLEPPEPIDPPDIERTDDEQDADTTVSNERSTERGDDRSPRVRRSDDVESTIARDEAAREAIARMHLMLGGITPEASGITNLLENGATPIDSRTLLESAEGATIATTDPNALHERRSECASCVRDTRLATLDPGRGPRQVEEGRNLVERIVVVAPPRREIVPIGPEPPPPECEGGVVASAVRLRMTAVQHCYERALGDDPDLEGRIEVSMRVTPLGTVSDVEVEENTTGSSELAACAVRSLATTRVMCSPEEPFDVRYPLVFRRQQ
jgi:hypothetical protein